MSKRTNPDFANYYVRDAQGNALATYSLKKDSLYLIEHNLYGSSRLGVKNLAILAQIDTQRQQISDTLRIFEERVGAKNYELSNHLGNVLATISDKTIFNTDHYNGIVYSVQLYYPFGWEIPTLSYAAKKYRFGFNGKEDDREWHAQDYGFRLYTPREGRFISVDPITAEYPELTPYQFASNTPIQAVDLDGLEAAVLSFGDGGSSQATNATELRKQFDLTKRYLAGQQTPGVPNRRTIKKGYGTDIIIQDEQGNFTSSYLPPSGAITPESDPITGGLMGFYRYGAKAFAAEVFSWGVEQATAGSGDPLAEMQLNTLDKKASLPDFSLKINGQKIRKGDLANTTVSTNGGNVHFDANGFPDFTPYSVRTVKIDMVGDHANDYKAANKKAGFGEDKDSHASVYPDHVWHHHQDGKSMMLVPKNVHSTKQGGVSHTGGAAVIKHNKNNPNDKLNFPSPPLK